MERKVWVSPGSPSELSVVVPAYNEAARIVASHERLVRVLRRVGVTYELVHVNDRSTDETLEKLRGIRASDPHMAIVDLKGVYSRRSRVGRPDSSRRGTPDSPKGKGAGVKGPRTGGSPPGVMRV